jgi:hypothetical protein
MMSWIVGVGLGPLAVVVAPLEGGEVAGADEQAPSAISSAAPSTDP